MKTYTSVMKINLLLLVLSLHVSCMAQQADCNKKSWTKKIRKALPSDICLSDSTMAYLLFSDFDYQSDHLNDIAIKVGNERIKDGDTVILEIYAQQSDSTFTKSKILDNIYPIYFKNYSLDYEIESSGLLKLKNRYQGFNPLEEMELKGSNFILRMLSDATTSFILTYKYSSNKKDWLLDKFELYDHYSEEVTEKTTSRIGSEIGKFNYFDYLEGRF